MIREYTTYLTSIKSAFRILFITGIYGTIKIFNNNNNITHLFCFQLTPHRLRVEVSLASDAQVSEQRQMVCHIRHKARPGDVHGALETIFEGAVKSLDDLDPGKLHPTLAGCV